ncbi:endonuclease domain-containing protein [Pantoea dispersa]|uniref:endonuclease domain-containing protein n=1 Tax=Pantoea dispersa TaxID=59814 RepID=UPI000F68858E|nr:endonuclease domain-containing protein [Pantoea dispersa]RRW73999.1 endonuclease domain-containing protein [Pantoea dispersa]
MNHTVQPQRALRKAMPQAEQKLWRYLRNRNVCGAKFRRQHPVGGYIVDFACVEQSLIVELDGGQHNAPEDQAYDARRTVYLQRCGWRVIRFWNHQVFNEFEAVMAEIYRCLMLAR